MYVLDTNTLIYYFKGMGNVGANFLAHPPKELAVPSIVIYEIEAGIAKASYSRKRRTLLRELTSSVEVLPFGSEEASTAARIRAKLEKKGTPIGPYDVLIAGTTLAKNATLVTHNTSEFERIDNLKIEDWF